MHVEHGDEGAADADQDESEEFGCGLHAHCLHPEQRRAFEDDVGDDIADCRRYGDRCERAQGVVAQDHFVGEYDSRDRGVERRRDCGSRAAAHPRRPHPPAVPVEAGREGAEGRPEMRERTVLPDRRPGPEGNQARQRAEEAGADRHPAIVQMGGADDVRRPVGPAVRHIAVKHADDEPARRRHADRGDDQPVRVAGHEAAARRDEQSIVQQGNQLDETDRGQGRQCAGNDAENGDRRDPEDCCRRPAHRPLSPDLNDGHLARRAPGGGTAPGVRRRPGRVGLRDQACSSWAMRVPSGAASSDGEGASLGSSCNDFNTP